MLRAPLRRAGFIPFDGERLTRLPAALEWYRPVIENGQWLVEQI